MSLIGYFGAFAGKPGDVDSTQKNPLGSRAFDESGNEYIYLQGVASTAVGDVVAFDEVHQTTRLLQATIGRIAVATAACVANTYGWYQIYGKNTAVKVLASFADNTMVYATSTAGSVDDSGVGAEEFINGMFGRSAISGGVATMELNYPYKHAANLD
jgi:hypothetical protein